MPNCYVLVGIPCAGKSTFAKNHKLPIISCDNIRKELHGKNYRQDKENEVWDTFYFRLGLFRQDFIVDNTNCHIKYINKIREAIHHSYEMIPVVFKVPMWKIYFRNYLRYFRTGKWIPLKVIKRFKKNFDKIIKDDTIFKAAFSNR